MSFSFSNPLRSLVLEKLPCGASFVLHSMPRAETAHCRVLVRTGSMHEAQDLGSGLSHFLEHMLFHGTKGFPGKNDISERVESCGGNLNACTSYDSTSYYMNLPADRAADGLRMLCDMMRFPLFPADKFRGEKNVILRECAMCRDNPDDVLYETLLEEMHRESPLRIPIIGVMRELKKTTRKRMIDYFKRRYAPERIVFIAAGKIDPDSLRALLLEATKGWHSESLQETPLPVEPRCAGQRERDVVFPDPLARVAAGWNVPPATHPDYPKTVLLAEILGGGISSRLYRSLKTESSLVSSIYADVDAYASEGVFLTAMTLPPENIDHAVRLLDAEFERIRKAPVSKREIARAVAQEETDLIRRMDSPEGAAREIAESLLQSGSLRYHDWYLEALRSVSPAELLDAAQRLLPASGRTLVRMRPEEKRTPKRNTLREKNFEPIFSKASNGGRSIFLQDKTIPLIDVSLFLPGALAFEREDEAGFSQLVARLLFADNARWKESEFAAFLDDHAISLSVSPANNSILLSANCAKGRLDRMIDAICAMLEAPLFPEQALEREKKIRIDRIRSILTRPNALALARIPSMLFENHPYGRTPERMIECVSAADPERLRSFFTRVVRNSGGAALAISGDLTERQASRAVDRIFSAGDWTTSPLERPAPPAPFSETKRFSSRLPAEQAVAALGMRIPFGVESQDFKSISLILEACNGMSSHLFQTVREKHGLAYYACLRGFQGFFTGSMTFLAGSEANSIEQVLSLLSAEADRLASHGLNQEEFDSAKKAVLFSMDAEASKPGARAAASALSEYLGEGFSAPWLARRQVEATTREDLKCVLTSIFSGEKAEATIFPDAPQKRTKK